MGRIFEISNGRKIEVLGAKIFSLDEYHLYRTNIPREVQCALSTTNYTNKLLHSFAASVCNEISYRHKINPVIIFSTEDNVMVGERFKLKDYKFCVIGSGLAICLESSRMGVPVEQNIVFAKTIVPFYIDLWFESLIDDDAVILSGETFCNKVKMGEIALPVLVDTREFEQTSNTYIEIDEYGALSKYIPAIGEKEVVIPEGVCAIRNEAFCLNQITKAQFKKITLPKSLKCIEEGTFGGINELEEIKLHPQNVAFALKDGAFYSCKLVKTQMAYILPDKNKSLDTLLLYPPAKSDVSELHISMESIKIAESAFAECQLEKIVIDATTVADKFCPLIYIEDKTFMNCKKLLELEVLGCEPLRFIGRNIFDGCNPNISVKFDNVITKMIPQGLISLDEKTMWYAQSKNDELIVPDGIKNFGCTLQSLFIKNTNDMLFLGVVAAKRNIACFKKIVLPESFSVILKETFCFCKKLEEIILSSKTKKLKGYTFYACNKLIQVTCLGLEGVAKCDFNTEGYLKKVVLGPNFDFNEYIFPKGTIIEAPKKSKTIKTAKKLGWNCIEI